jgi:hypothetical protein
MPPVPGAGSRGAVAHISIGGGSRRSLHNGAGGTGPDGSAPVPRASKAAMGLAALLASSSPQLSSAQAAAGLVTPAHAHLPPHSAPLFALHSPLAAQAALDSEPFSLANGAASSSSSTTASALASPTHGVSTLLSTESGLMAALNSAAQGRFDSPGFASSATPIGERKTNGAGGAFSSAAAAAAASRSSSLGVPHHHHASMLASPAPSVLLQLTSPMLMRGGGAAGSAAPWATRVLPGLWLGSAKHASDLAALRAHGITHICNAADDVGNFFAGEFLYLNLHVADCGQDKGIARVFTLVEKWVRDSGFRVPSEEELGWDDPDADVAAAALEAERRAEQEAAAASASAAAAGGRTQQGGNPPVRILIHCAKGVNRSVTVVLALLLQLYPSWSLERAHALLLARRHPPGTCCPFKDNRAELLRFERQMRGGTNSMTDKHFRTRMALDA